MMSATEVSLSGEYRDRSQVPYVGLFREPRRRRRDLVVFTLGCLVLAYFLSSPSMVRYEDDRLIWFAYAGLAASILLQGAAELLPQRWTTPAGVVRICSSVLLLVFLVLLVLDLVS